jgi:hypothetical protein
MPRYLKTNATAKAGINYIRTIVEAHNCIFQKIDQENDVGVDAFKAYWINIKTYLKDNPNHTVISYTPTLANIINKTTFVNQFVPHLTGEVPNINFDLAKQLFESNNPDEFYLGLYTLFKKYADKNEVWKIFIDYFKTHSVDEIPEMLVYYLSVIPWHPDMWFYKDTHTEQSRNYGKTLIDQFQKHDIEKLLHFVDEENMISRGSLGQSVEAIVSSVPNFLTYLEEIIKDKSQEIKIREFAAIIYAYHKGADSISVLSAITAEESWYIQELINNIKEYGDFNPY